MDFQNFEILFQKKTKGLFIKDVYYMNEMFIFFYRHKSSSSIFTFSWAVRNSSNAMKPFDFAILKTFVMSDSNSRNLHVDDSVTLNRYRKYRNGRDEYVFVKKLDENDVNVSDDYFNQIEDDFRLLHKPLEVN